MVVVVVVFLVVVLVVVVRGGGEGGGGHRYSEHVPRPGARSEAGGGATAAKRVAPGLFEGLKLLLRHPYVLGIFAVSALFEARRG